MRRVVLLVIMALLGISAGHSSPPAADWAINATAIEACSCPHFCMCYFNPHPAGHHEHGKTEHYCPEFHRKNVHYARFSEATYRLPSG